MSTLLNKWLQGYGLPSSLIETTELFLNLLTLFVCCAVLLYISRLVLLHSASRLVKKTTMVWDDYLHSSGFFTHLSHLIPVSFFYILIPYFFAGKLAWISALEKGVDLYLIVTIYLASNSVLITLTRVYDDLDFGKRVPIRGFFQILRLLILVISVLFVIASILDKSPMYLLSGIGALTAVFLLVFKDTILGLVAGIQLAANRMLAHGDWIEIPKLAINGTVLEIGLTTVKVQNWDNTISYLPTHGLISESFKNWKGMERSGGRRFKRILVIDPESLKAIEDETREHRTNLAAFRAEISEYLQQHPQVNNQLTQLIRIVSPDVYGIHLEIYFFITDKRWVQFESIAAEIYEELVVMMNKHQLRFSNINRLQSSPAFATRGG